MPFKHSILPLCILGAAAMALQAGEVTVILNPASGQSVNVYLVSQQAASVGMGTPAVELLVEGKPAVVLPVEGVDGAGVLVAGKALKLKSTKMKEYLIMFKSNDVKFQTLIKDGLTSMSVDPEYSKWFNEKDKKGAYAWADKKLTISFPK
jgi:hypothetical protein